MLGRDNKKDDTTKVSAEKVVEKPEQIGGDEAVTPVVTEAEVDNEAVATSEEKAKQVLSPLNLYTQNAKAAFFDVMNGNDGSYKAGFLNFVHGALLPVTLTVGAGAKAVVDYATREPLAEKDVEDVKLKISEVDDKGFDALVASITDYAPRSSESRELLSSLKYDPEAAANHLKAYRNTVEEKMKEEIIAVMTSQLDPQLAGQFSLNANFKFNETQQTQIDGMVANELGRYRADFRQNQRQYLIDYLDNEFNAGKKMEHVIKDSVLSRPN